MIGYNDSWPQEGEKRGFLRATRVMGVDGRTRRIIRAIPTRDEKMRDEKEQETIHKNGRRGVSDACE